MEIPKCNACGKPNWPKQAWMHENCRKTVPLLKQETTKSRHGKYADKEKRRKYMREYMAMKRLK